MLAISNYYVYLVIKFSAYFVLYITPFKEKD